MRKIYTKRGDQGDTDLLYGGRVSKTDPRCAACGSVDEAVSALGLARALSVDPKVQVALKDAQRELFLVGGELATDVKEYDTYKRHFAPVTSQMTERLEKLIDGIEGQVHLPASFVIPGASPASAAIDLARSILRRAEREAVGLKERRLLINPEILRYLNRLSDLLFMLARYEDREQGYEALSDEKG
ncbi:MAG: cob(I)yrinic acid a,c-diamide adenosyltransferase [Chloroflexi bacterium]|nr:cob(I)yrinic acid a,c-diamide adenosyltransferase [Chloroflexota bacterium]